MRRKLGTAVAALFTLTLCACTPAEQGLIGVMLSSDGSPVAILAPCDGYIDTAILTKLDSDGGFGDRVERWDFEAADDLRQLEVGTAIEKVDPEVHLALQAWSDTGRGSQYLGYLSFTSAQVAQLNAGRVLFAENYRDTLEGSVDEFEAASDRSC